MKATQQLKDEHEGIKIMLKIMEVISGNLEKDRNLNIDHFEKIIDFIKGFADKCHHGKEEEIFFPALINHGMPQEGGPIGVMLFEHEQGRNFIKELSHAFDEFKKGNKNAIDEIVKNTSGYIQLLRNHIEKENNILFMMADKVLNDAEQSEIADSFEELKAKKIGIGKHEEYHKLLKEFKSVYLQ